MTPSELHNRNELAACQETLKTGTAEQKAIAKARIKELELLLGITHKKEKASIATDEQIEQTS